MSLRADPSNIRSPKDAATIFASSPLVFKDQSPYRPCLRNILNLQVLITKAYGI
ncbi:MAG: hypothetical protein QXI39_02495 [Candidatus Bathyarchaeia archaeon]